jgi:hypothetical protein
MKIAVMSIGTGFRGPVIDHSYGSVIRETGHDVRSAPRKLLLTKTRKIQNRTFCPVLPA